MKKKKSTVTRAGFRGKQKITVARTGLKNKIRTGAAKRESMLLHELLLLIERSHNRVAVVANSALAMLFWQMGKRINEHILQNRRAEYGKEIVVTLSRQLSWSHFITLLPLKNEEARLFYAHRSAEEYWGVRELRESMARKEFERHAIAKTQLRATSPDAIVAQSHLLMRFHPFTIFVIQ